MTIYRNPKLESEAVLRDIHANMKTAGIPLFQFNASPQVGAEKNLAGRVEGISTLKILESGPVLRNLFFYCVFFDEESYSYFIVDVFGDTVDSGFFFESAAEAAAQAYKIYEKEKELMKYTLLKLIDPTLHELLDDLTQ